MFKILIVGPNLESFGGVAFLLNSLKKNGLFSNNDYFEYGNNKNILDNISDLIKFYKKFKVYDVVHFNPSFEYKSIFRDFLLSSIVLFFNKKVILSWMGWNEDVENKFLNNFILKYILLKIINNKSVIQIVSNDGFVHKLKKMGCSQNIEVIFPPYDSYLDNFNFEQKNLTSNDKIRILFLARIEKSKGIDKLIEIFDLLKNDPRFEFTVAGDGIELSKLKTLAKEKNIDINFTGFIKGEDKIELFKNSDLFLFPSVHSEGIPLILVEAMYAGLFLIVSDTGGIPYVINNNNGFVLNKFSTAKDFYNKIKFIDICKFNKVSRNNIKQAKENFSSEIIVSKYKKLYESII